MQENDAHSELEVQPEESEGRRTPGAHLPVPWPGEDLLSVPSAYVFHESRRAVTQPEWFRRDEDSPWPVARIGSLDEHGYAPPQGAAPILAGYVADGWSFVAVRLAACDLRLDDLFIDSGERFAVSLSQLS